MYRPPQGRFVNARDIGDMRDISDRRDAGPYKALLSSVGAIHESPVFALAAKETLIRHTLSGATPSPAGKARRY